jgi:perosamine synthetase
VNDAERKITEKTRAIMPVHLYGHPCDMDAVMTLAKKHSLLVVEDCAEAIGTKYDGQFAGTFGDMACFSFFGNKTITTGEGGMVVSNHPDHADKALRLKGQGLAKGREYWHDLIGYNYRMTNICAAIGCAQIESIEEIVDKKQAIATWYQELLKDIPVQVQGVKPGTFHSFWMVSILTNEARHRDPLRSSLKEQGVETRPLFYPVHLMDMYRQEASKYPVAENLASRGITLPSYPDLTRDDVTQICMHINDYFGVTGNK